MDSEASLRLNIHVADFDLSFDNFPTFRLSCRSIDTIFSMFYLYVIHFIISVQYFEIASPFYS